MILKSDQNLLHLFIFRGLWFKTSLGATVHLEVYEMILKLFV